MKLKEVLFIFLVLFVMEESFSQTKEVLCLSFFKSKVSEVLHNVSNNEFDIYSDSVRIMFGLSVLESGIIDSVIIYQNNLTDFGIDKDSVISKIEGMNISCIRELYYQEGLPTFLVMLIYNSKSTPPPPKQAK
jgi:hypothetical protein